MKIEDKFKVFHCNWLYTGSYGSYEEYDCIVIAETESVALGMALYFYPDTDAARWTIEEIPTDKRWVQGISHII